MTSRSTARGLGAALSRAYPEAPRHRGGGARWAQAVTWDQLAALASFGQFVVVTAAAIFVSATARPSEAAKGPDRPAHLRRAEPPSRFAAALEVVYNHLPERLDDPDYFQAIREGTATASSHNELIVMHFFNEIGLLVHEKLVSELIVPYIASPCVRAWDRLAPVVELMRRRYPHAYTPLEAPVARARAVDLSAINARFRSRTPRLRAQWERTARDLTARRITLFDEADERPRARI